LFVFSTFARGNAPNGYVLEWQDDFSVPALDGSVWRAEEYLRDGARLTSKAVSIQNGMLRISTYSQDESVYSGFLTTRGLREFSFGYFESRIRFKGAPGQHCAFWLQSPKYALGDDDPSVFGVEVDIVEHSLVNRLGNDVGNRALFNIHWNGYGFKHRTDGGSWKNDVSLNNEWHVYGLLWETKEYVFYVDGIERWRTNMAVSAVPEEVRLTCEVKDGSWKGGVPKGGYGGLSSTSPGMEVDWVRVWRKP